MPKTSSGHYGRWAWKRLETYQTNHATPQNTQNSKSSTMAVKSSGQDHIGHIRTCLNMFRIPPETWPVSNLNQSPSCDTSNHSACKNLFNGSQMKCPTPHWPHPDMFEHVPETSGEVISFWLEPKTIMRLIKSFGIHKLVQWKPIQVPRATLATSDHVRTCSGYFRGSGQFLTWSNTHHARHLWSFEI